MEVAYASVAYLYLSNQRFRPLGAGARDLIVAAPSCAQAPMEHGSEVLMRVLDSDYQSGSRQDLDQPRHIAREGNHRQRYFGTNY